MALLQKSDSSKEWDVCWEPKGQYYKCLILVRNEISVESKRAVLQQSDSSQELDVCWEPKGHYYKCLILIRN